MSARAPNGAVAAVSYPSRLFEIATFVRPSMEGSASLKVEYPGREPEVVATWTFGHPIGDDGYYALGMAWSDDSRRFLHLFRGGDPYRPAWQVYEIPRNPRAPVRDLGYGPWVNPLLLRLRDAPSWHHRDIKDAVDWILDMRRLMGDVEPASSVSDDPNARSSGVAR
ncbi:MAG: hypothetical protein FJX72_10395 [Armatimonadetes bacterium]|nr:hypothetical protein [Armatimonadota bacterium]